MDLNQNDRPSSVDPDTSGQTSALREKMQRVVRLAARSLQMALAVVGWHEQEEWRSVWYSRDGTLPDPILSDPTSTQSRPSGQSVEFLVWQISQQVLCERAIVLDAAELKAQISAFPNHQSETGPWTIARYAGIPLYNAAGEPLGFLALADDHPHSWTTDDTETLHDLATLAVDAFRLTQPERSELQQTQTLDKLNPRAIEPRSALGILHQAAAAIGGFRIYADHRYEYEYLFDGCQFVLGYTAQDFLNDSDLWRSRVLPEDLEAVILPAIANILTEGTATIEYRFRHKDNSIRWISDTYTSRRDDAADCWIVTSFGIDITEKKQLEQALQQSERKLSDILNHAFACISSFRVFADRRMECEYKSAGCATIYGFSPEEFIANPLLWQSRMFSEDFEAQMLPCYNEIFQERPAQLEYRFRHKDGSLRWIMGQFTSRRESDDCWRVTCVATDMTQHKQAIEERDRLQAQCEHLFNLSLDMLVIFRLDGTLSLINPAWERTLGYSEAEFRQYRLDDLIHSDDRAETWNHLQRLHEGYSVVNYENRYRCRDGNYKWLLWTAVPFLEEGMVYCVARDITDRKQTELQTLRSLNEKDLLLRELHHRVKNNLQIVSSLLDLQSQFAQQPILTEICRESQHRIRAMALIHENFHSGFSMNRICMSTYTTELVGYLRRACTIDATRIAIQLDVEPIALSIDEAVPCGLILNELVSNALKHGFPPPMSGRIQIRLFQCELGVTLIVSNNGVDFPEGVNIETTRTLGFQLISSLVQQLSGQLQLTSKDETTITIHFPHQSP